jgi:acyl-coenzyme A thioesterase PaaI-like protein
VHSCDEPGAAKPSQLSANRKEIEMRKVVVNEWMSLDGVVQAPGAPEEDTSGGFAHGGWHMPYMDETAQNAVLDGLTQDRKSVV